jgi:hypothetical protein
LSVHRGEEPEVKIVVAIALSLAVVAASSLASADARPSVVVTVLPAKPYQPGDRVWTTSAPTGTFVPDATGCQRVPGTGYLGTNAYANTASEYANHWDWSAGSAAQLYNWWLKHNDGTTARSGSTTSGGSVDVGANIYYWRVQNKGATPQAWNVCYDVL